MAAQRGSAWPTLAVATLTAFGWFFSAVQSRRCPAASPTDGAMLGIGRAQRLAARCRCWCWLVYGGLLVLTYWGFHAICRPASFPSRTRATCSSACSCPTPPRAERTDEVMRQDREDRPRNAGHQERHGHLPGNRSRSVRSARISARCSSSSRISAIAAIRACTSRRDHRQAQRSGFAAEVPEASRAVSSRPPPSRAWAAPAASRSWSRTAATLGLAALQDADRRT